jgi:hypothetical protein
MRAFLTHHIEAFGFLGVAAQFAMATRIPRSRTLGSCWQRWNHLRRKANCPCSARDHVGISHEKQPDLLTEAESVFVPKKHKTVKPKDAAPKQAKPREGKTIRQHAAPQYLLFHLSGCREHNGILSCMLALAHVVSATA